MLKEASFRLVLYKNNRCASRSSFLGNDVDARYGALAIKRRAFTFTKTLLNVNYQDSFTHLQTPLKA